MQPTRLRPARVGPSEVVLCPTVDRRLLQCSSPAAKYMYRPCCKAGPSTPASDCSMVGTVAPRLGSWRWDSSQRTAFLDKGLVQLRQQTSQTRGKRGSPDLFLTHGIKFAASCSLKAAPLLHKIRRASGSRRISPRLPSTPASSK